MISQVTVGIPFLNAARTLGDAIRSVFAQHLKDWTLLLVDDGSTDGSLEIARSVRDSRVVVLSDGTNRGLVWRLNEIARRARSPLLARMDADDLMHPDRMARQVEHFRRVNTDVLGTATYTMNGAGEVIGIRGDGPLPTSVGQVLRRSLFVHPTVMFKTAFAQAHPYEEDYPRAEDLALWCRVCETARCAVLPEPLLFYREPVPICLPNYLLSTRTTRKVLHDFGTSLPLHQRSALLLKSHLSDLAYRATARVGGQGWLVRRRARTLDPEERAGAQTIISEIQSTSVPGFASRLDLADPSRRFAPR